MQLPLAIDRPKGHKRVTLSIPKDLNDNLNVLTRYMKVSKSALCSTLLSEPILEMRRMVDVVREAEGLPPDERDVALSRLRGESVAFIEQRVQDAMDAMDRVSPKGGKT